MAIVDEEGFERLSLRSVARRLGVTPMALYTYVRSSDELVRLVVDRLVEVKARGLELPSDWRGALRTFATDLAELLAEHPAMLRAYADGVVNTGEAMRVADSVLARLVADGLETVVATEAYLTVHMLVLGVAVVNQRRAAPAPDLSQHPTLAPYLAVAQRLVEQGYLDSLLDVVLDGVEARQQVAVASAARG